MLLFGDFRKAATFCSLIAVVAVVEYVIILYMTGTQLSASSSDRLVLVELLDFRSNRDSHPLEHAKSSHVHPEKPVLKGHSAAANSSRRVTSNMNHFFNTSRVCRNSNNWHLVECDGREPRQLSEFEENGNNILLSLRTTVKFHASRLPVLFDTWLTTINLSNVFIMTDGHNSFLEHKIEGTGIHYVISEAGKHYTRLCYKAGDEMSLLFQPGSEHYDWICHVDDDMYVNLKVLVRTLAKFDPKTEPVYFGRSAYEPRYVDRFATLGTPYQKYYFAVGGMYCLSRVLVERAKEYLVGSNNFGRSCKKTLQPEDVTVGFISDVLLNVSLKQTQLIHTHGLELPSEVDHQTLADQVAFSYGFGAVRWGFFENVITVPHALFTMKEDPSRFRSLHCHLYPLLDWCVAKMFASLNNTATTAQEHQKLYMYNQSSV